MATVGFVLTDIQQPSVQIPAQPGAALGPQANATPAQGATQQADTVTLTGRAAESQESATGGAGSFGSSAFFFAESQTFRAANGSGGNQASQPSVPNLPVKITDESPAGSAQNTAANPPAQGATQDGATNQPAPQTNATAATNGLTSAAGSAGAADTPLAELAQLDDTLQQMGINPQSISLFNRMAMLLYANDPAALRVLVQAMQSGAQQSTDSASGSAASPNPSSPDAVQQLLPSQGQVQSAPASPQESQNQVNATATQSGDDQAAPVNPILGGGQGATWTSLSGTGAASFANAGNSSDGQTPSSATFSTQLNDLQTAFAAVGAQQLLPGSQTSQPGQLLNVTA